MKNSTLILLLVFSLTLLNWSADAQIPTGAPAMQTPNAASLGLFGNVPVSLFSGIPSISIPLYTLEEGSISVPLSLNYHASGFKPDVHPGWVGVGWNLTAGGSIQRSIRDRIDEMAAPTTPYASINLGYYYQHRLLDNPTWEQATFIENTLIKGTGGNTSTDFNYLRDTEPDEFSFSFLGYEGSFYLTHKGTWQARCDKPIKVTVLTTPSLLMPPPFKSIDSDKPYPQSFAGFVITGEDGTQYQFGGTTDAIEYSTDFFKQGFGESQMTANAWQLTKITGADGRVITFTYQRETGAGRFINHMYHSIYWDLGSGVSNEGRPWGSQSNCAGSFTFQISTDVRSFVSGQLLAPVYLTAITTPTQTINFTSSLSTELRYDNARAYDYKYQQFLDNPRRPHQFFLPMLDNSSVSYPESLQKLQWKKLDKITIGKLGQNFKVYRFVYSDRPGNEYKAAQQRLTLETLTEGGINPFTSPIFKEKNPYIFTYYIPDIFQEYNGHFTGYLTNKIDHWGFWNDVIAALDYVDTYYGYARARSNVPAEIGTPESPRSRLPLFGMLTKITYPTGGHTEFEYELHQYGKSMRENRSLEPESFYRRFAGGLRIRKIKSYATEIGTPTLVKEYFYIKGFRNTVAGYPYPVDPASLPSSGVLNSMPRYIFEDYQTKVIGTAGTYTKSVFSSQPVITASNNRGTHVGYSEVVEKLSDGSYTKYTYSNFDTGPAYRDEVVSPSSSLMPQRTIYQPYISAEETRGKLLKEEVYRASDRPVKVRTLMYEAVNKNPDRNLDTEYVRAVQADASLACSTTSTDGIEEGTSYRIPTYSFLPVREEVTLYDSNGQNTFTTTTTTTYTPTKLIASTSSTDSQGQPTVTTYRYPPDFAPQTANAPLTADESRALSSMVTRNIISPPVEIVTTRNGRLTGAHIQTFTWGGEGNKYILPYKSYKLALSRPLTTSQYSTEHPSSSTYLYSILSASQMRLKATCSLYDAQCNLLGMVEEGGRKTSYLWGYGNTLPIAVAVNATPHDFLADSFEEENKVWDGGLDYIGTPFNRVAHAGTMAGRLTANLTGSTHSFHTPGLVISPSAQRYVISCWVRTDGPLAEVSLFKSRSQDVQADVRAMCYANQSPGYVESVSTTLQGQWVYLEKVVDVPSDVVRLTLCLTSGPGKPSNNVWFDDVRLHSVDTHLTTYTHYSGIGITSQSDVNNRPTYFDYDVMSRLQLVRDHLRTILKLYYYQYSR